MKGFRSSKCVKDKEGNVLVTDDNIRDRLFL